jgi:hypothetical protein
LPLGFLSRGEIQPSGCISQREEFNQTSRPIAVILGLASIRQGRGRAGCTAIWKASPLTTCSRSGFVGVYAGLRCLRKERNDVEKTKYQLDGIRSSAENIN